VLKTHRIVVSTHGVLLNALRHAFIRLGDDIGLLVFDEAHHAADKHDYNLIMREFYDELPPRVPEDADKTMRPMILGLTASPIFGGATERNFRQLQQNLDSTICAPLQFREMVEVRPELKPAIYAVPEYRLEGIPPSRNLQSLGTVIASLDIEEDPQVLSLRAELRQLEPGPKRNHTDQQLSEAIDKHKTYTQTGLRDFERAAKDICSDLGEWAADWYIQQVCKHATGAGNTFPEFFFTSESEKEHLLKHLSRVEITPVPDDDPEDILRRTSNKVEKLVHVLLEEKNIFEKQKKKDDEKEDYEKENGEKVGYCGLVFVKRRDTVLALTEILTRHPRTAQEFTVGSLLGESDNTQHRSFLDITRRLLRQPANKTLKDFRAGNPNLIVATAVAEEGLDIQACCNVVRWDMPPNMVSWVQSRGRARQKLSSFVLMLTDKLEFELTKRRWEEQEKEMIKLYNTTQEYQAIVDDEDTNEDESLRFTVDATG
jgi:endoribonuclease Dicer